jgi:SepF-like predicted cell division protein (DUF552 family)
MRTVSEYLRALIEKQVKEKGLVVWFDPEQHYSSFVQDLTLSDTAVAIYQGSYFELRHKVEPLMAGDSAPRLVVYVPKSRDETEDALIELVAAGVVMEPGGKGSLPRNTRLSVIAKGALRDSHSPADLEAIARQVEAGKLTLADLDRLTTVRDGDGGGVISTIFGTGDPRKVALEFVGSSRYDADIVSRHAAEEIAQLLSNKYGIDLTKYASVDEQRTNLARHILLTEFVSSLKEPIPAELDALKVASEDGPRTECVDLAREWRLRRDLRESYADHAERVSKELQAIFPKLAPEQIYDCETFADIETRLQVALESRLARSTRWDGDQVASLRQLINTRLAGFWASWPDRYPEVATRWQIISSALDVLTTADAVEAQTKTAIGEPSGLLKRYIDEWYMLDTYQRHLERRCHLLDFDSEGRHESTEKLIARARQRYMEAAGGLAEAFVRALERAGFTIPNYRKQLEIYATYVRPAINDGKTAYVLVDALRYEMACELARTLRNDYSVQLEATIGTVPTITPIGMAALMPGAEVSANVVPLGGGALGLRVEGTVLKDRAGRVEWFKSKHSGVVAVEKLEDVLLSFKEAKKTQLREADIILVTSQEIDRAGESISVREARRIMAEILGDLVKLVNKLRDFGCKKIIITADHGYVFGDEPGSDMMITPPSGQRISLHSRAWIGKGGSNDPAYLRTKLSNFGLDDGHELEIAVPYGFGVFTAPGGASAYYHGGMSPQEIIIPVIILTVESKSAMPLTSVALDMTLGSSKITTRFCSIQVKGRATSLVDVKPPRVRVEIRAGKQVIGQPVSASYGFVEATGEVQLEFAGDGDVIKPDTIMLMITHEQISDRVSLHLMDALTGLELATLTDVEVAISI